MINIDKLPQKSAITHTAQTSNNSDIHSSNRKLLGTKIASFYFPTRSIR